MICWESLVYVWSGTKQMGKSEKGAIGSSFSSIDGVQSGKAVPCQYSPAECNADDAGGAPERRMMTADDIEDQEAPVPQREPFSICFFSFCRQCPHKHATIDHLGTWTTSSGGTPPAQ